MKRVYCVNCGVFRMAEIDMRQSEKECKKTTNKLCPVCSCPFVEGEKQ